MGDKSNIERVFSETQQLVSITDLDGIITYANNEFCEISGYSLEELVGENHNIVRHPSMPKAAFADLWSKLKRGDSWRGMVKNRCKNGDYYWVDAYITPVFTNDKVTGYQSVRILPSNEQKRNAQQLYNTLNNGGSIAGLDNNVNIRRLLALVIITMTSIGGWLYTNSILPSIVLLCCIGLLSLVFLPGQDHEIYFIAKI